MVKAMRFPEDLKADMESSIFFPDGTPTDLEEVPDDTCKNSGKVFCDSRNRQGLVHDGFPSGLTFPNRQTVTGHP
jgi:hypothetical protein